QVRLRALPAAAQLEQDGHTRRREAHVPVKRGRDVAGRLHELGEERVIKRHRGLHLPWSAASPRFPFAPCGPVLREYSAAQLRHQELARKERIDQVSGRRRVLVVRLWASRLTMALLLWCGMGRRGAAQAS